MTNLLMVLPPRLNIIHFYNLTANIEQVSFIAGAKDALACDYRGNSNATPIIDACGSAKTDEYKFGGIMFNPVNGKGMTANVALQIEAAILGDHFSPGEKLPSERDLQHLFKTGRGVIREALRELKQKGLIETRQGGNGGTYVKQVGANDASQPLALLIRQQEIDAEKLIEFRESIDRTVTLLAITRANDQETETLLDKVTELEKAGMCKTPSMKRIGEVDQELNLLLVNMTKNPIFEWIMRTIQLSFGSYDDLLYEDSDYREKTIINWRETAAAIAQREPLKALSFIGYHYVLLNRCIRENEERQQVQLHKTSGAGS